MRGSTQPTEAARPREGAYRDKSDPRIELCRIRTAVERAGYAGPIEVEIFNQAVWDTPLDILLPLMKERYLACV